MAAVKGDRVRHTPLPPNDFTLGGPFRFGAYNVGELRSSDFVVVSGGLMREFAGCRRCSEADFLAAAWIETGSAFDGEGVRDQCLRPHS